MFWPQPVGSSTSTARSSTTEWPALLERALTPIPMDALFISDAMARLPDHRRMRVVAGNLRLGRGDWTWEHEVRDSFNAALCQTLDIPDPPEEDGWD